VVQVPAGGGSVSNLFARVNTAPATGQSYTVEVLDNGSPFSPTAISCSITAGNTTCTNTGASASVSAGHYLQVKITNVGGAPNKAFTVSFRW
jgi:hypothetical protein